MTYCDTVLSGTDNKYLLLKLYYCIMVYTERFDQNIVCCISRLMYVNRQKIYEICKQCTTTVYYKCLKVSMPKVLLKNNK